MILRYNVCDYCKTSKEIYENEDAIQDMFSVKLRMEHVSHRRKTLSSFRRDIDGESFCDLDCFINYLKKNFNEDGTKKGEEDAPF